MKTITRTLYIANDGTEFLSEQKCREYESEKAKLDAIFKGIPQWPDKHGSFVVVPRITLLNARRELWKLVLKEYGDSWPQWKTWDADEVHPMSVVGRVLDDCGGLIAKAWSKMRSWDFEKGRIYDQPYFASHPDEALELNETHP